MKSPRLKDQNATKNTTKQIDLFQIQSTYKNRLTAFKHIYIAMAPKQKVESATAVSTCSIN